ncbi:membrane protein DedA, SNARE-associated domain [Blastococcus fimeti]|nr:membrane protein DedA, SNARE-associated domain [Blastococcus fimeti]
MDLLTAAAEGTSVGYPLLFFGVLLGSVLPVLPTGAVVGSAAAFAMTSNDLGLPTVLALATLAALLGDLITFAVCRFGGPAAVRWIARGQHTERLEEVREQFRRHGWQIIVVGRLLPAGRIPVLLAAGALSYPWKRLVPAQLFAALLWALAYALLGVISGGVFDSPLVAVLIATVLVLLVGAVLNVVGARRRRRRAPSPEPDRAPEPSEVR